MNFSICNRSSCITLLSIRNEYIAIGFIFIIILIAFLLKMVKQND